MQRYAIEIARIQTALATVEARIADAVRAQ
jgi:hypothetical protein